MPSSTWGCEVCRAEIHAVKFDRVVLIGEAKTTFLQIWQCQECHQWYEWQFNGRIFDREPGQARSVLAQFAEGY